jgi:malonate decarboxylase epsilon subunit
MNIALIFPGQGAQTPGFLHELSNHLAVQETLAEASELLAQDVLTLDSEAALTSTVSTQIALLVAGAAFARFCQAERVQPTAVAGMSVGAFAAAFVAGSIDLSAAITLVRRRAELMDAAFPAGTHGMLVVDGLRLSSVKPLIEGFDAVIANYNCATQHVLAGRIVDLISLAERAVDAGAHTTKLLRMSVASHTPELLPAAHQLLEFARQLPIAAPRIAVYSNRSARPLETADEVRDELALNMAYPVRWHDTATALGGLGVELLIEAPPGHTLTRLASAILPDVPAMAAAETRWDVILRAARRA